MYLHSDRSERLYNQNVDFDETSDHRDHNILNDNYQKKKFEYIRILFTMLHIAINLNMFNK